VCFTEVIIVECQITKTDFEVVGVFFLNYSSLLVGRNLRNYSKIHVPVHVVGILMVCFPMKYYSKTINFLSNK